MKLLLPEEGSATARQLWQEATAVVSSRLLYVETTSAIAAAARARRLSTRGADRAIRRLHELLVTLFVVEVSKDVVALAGDLTERHALGASDAVHLASALALENGELVLASWDQALRRATAEVGLTVAPGDASH